MKSITISFASKKNLRFSMITNKKFKHNQFTESSKNDAKEYQIRSETQRAIYRERLG